MISVDGVTKRFGSLVAVDDVSFEIDRGEVVGFLGPNGAGKTTTMRMLSGTLQPDDGDVRFEGVPIGRDLTAAKRRVGYLPEANPLYDEMLVCEYLEFAADLRGVPEGERRSAILGAVDETGVGDVFFRPISELSKGYRQRVGLAQAILHRPEILVLDEPTEGLDPNQRVEIRRLVNELGKERTVLLSTHVMQEVEAVCSRILIITRGRLVADGTVEEIQATRQGIARYSVELAGADPSARRLLGELPGVSTVDVGEVEGRMRFNLGVAGGQELRPRIFQMAQDRGWTLWELHRERATLEEAFQELTSDASPSGPEDGAAAGRPRPGPEAPPPPPPVREGPSGGDDEEVAP